MARGRGFSPPDIYCTMAGDFIVHAWPVPLLYQGDLTTTDHQEMFETTGVHAYIRYRKIWGQCVLTLKGPVTHIEAAREFVQDIIYLRSTCVPAPRPGKWGWQNVNVWAHHGYAHRAQQQEEEQEDEEQEHEEEEEEEDQQEANTNRRLRRRRRNRRRRRRRMKRRTSNMRRRRRRMLRRWIMRARWISRR